MRPGGDQWLVGDGAAVGFDHLNEECLAVGHPLHLGGAGAHAAASATAAAHDGVEAHAFDLARLTGGVAEPELDAALGGVGEGEAGGVGAPASRGEPGVGGKIDFDLGAFGDLAQAEGAVEGGVMQPGGFGIDAHTGDAQHGLRQFGNRGVSDGLALHGEMAAGADRQGGREG